MWWKVKGTNKEWKLRIRIPILSIHFRQNWIGFQEERTVGVADPEIVANDPAFTCAQQNDVISGGHACDNPAPFGRVSFQKIHREYLSSWIHLRIIHVTKHPPPPIYCNPTWSELKVAEICIGVGEELIWQLSMERRRFSRDSLRAAWTLAQTRDVDLDYRLHSNDDVLQQIVSITMFPLKSII